VAKVGRRKGLEKIECLGRNPQVEPLEFGEGCVCIVTLTIRVLLGSKGAGMQEGPIELMQHMLTPSQAVVGNRWGTHGRCRD